MTCRIAFKGSFVLLLVMMNFVSNSQVLTNMIDTTTSLGKSVLSVAKKFNNIKITGYLQPQFQAATSKGAESYNGGDFAENSNNRFMLRRGRVRVEYLHLNKDEKPSVQFLFQIDGTERGVGIRDVLGRIYENQLSLFSLSAGIFTRPFSYELNLSSSDRESPERGRMSQILMRGERDIGAMISFEPRKKDHPLRYIKLDAGLFNGQGLNGTTDFDSRKDLISRLSLKSFPVSKMFTLSAALSCLNGGLLQNTKYVYRLGNTSGVRSFTADSSLTNIGKISPRKYYGGDMQFRIKNKVGFTELRAEYMQGTQTGSSNTSETPSALPTRLNNAYHIRKFDGAYFYFMQHLLSVKHQLVVKYDWYDPNREVSPGDIGKAGSNLNEADIKYSTLGFGYIYYHNSNLKLVLYYDKVKNETTGLPGYSSDVKDDIFTCRLQFRF